MREVIRAYQDCCAGVIARFDGHVARFMGDGVLAYFGYPVAHEDDAERAVRAALDLVAAVGKLSSRQGVFLQLRVGIATGMYYTPQGGDIMFVEASVRRHEITRAPEDGEREGRGGPISLILTGQLGDVMKESARAALTYATNNAAALGIPGERLTGVTEAHIHVPAGAIPKDGPSAGIAIATAIVSELSGQEVRRDVAMTGEITLRGRVLPIGGVKEKVLGAHRAGIKTIIIPRQNEADLADVPDEVRKELSFHPVDTLSEVLRIALVDGEHRVGAMAA